MIAITSPRLAPARKAPALEFRLLLALAFCVFLVTETASRLMPRRAGAGPRRSILAEARAAASRTIPLAFMG
jgi:hypothetical protein